MSDVSPLFPDIPSGTVHRTIGLLHGALTQLKADLDNQQIEKIGVMVHRAMSTQQRSFHTPEHIFDLSTPDDPHSTLAALFHDIVYYQVDNGFLDEIAEILAPYIEIREGNVYTRQDISATDRAFHGCAAVFGFSTNQHLPPFGGLNEFLSALVMDVLLIGTVTDVDLMIATACIEETIPFRGRDENGDTPPVVLERRIKATNEAFGLGLSDQDIRNAVIAAVCFSNKDVHNFAEEDPGRFLDNTWKLLPESNPALRFRGLYTITNYSLALMKMEGFLSVLKPESVFHEYDGFPVEKEYARLVNRTATNLDTARRYLGVKMISAALLQALAEPTGGDAPIAYFMGDISPLDERSNLAAHLPAAPDGCARAEDDANDLFRLLKHGRASSSGFDLQNSPVSLYVHRCLDDEAQRVCVAAARAYIKGEQTREPFLQTVPSHLVASISRAAAYMAFTRRDQLLAIAAQYNP